MFDLRRTAGEINTLCAAIYAANRHFRVKLDVPCNVCDGKGYTIEGEFNDEVPCPSPVHERPDDISRMMMLTVCELAESFEGYRKNLKDAHLPHRDAFEVELADAVIRICDLAASRNMDLGGAVMEKMQFNRTREDHKISSRTGLPGAKQF